MSRGTANVKFQIYLSEKRSGLSCDKVMYDPSRNDYWMKNSYNPHETEYLIEAFIVNIYRVKSRSVPAWGDYGYYLINGAGKRDSEGRFGVNRTGPFVPPLYLTGGSVLIADGYRKKLDAKAEGFAYESVRYDNVIKIDWDKWDFNMPPQILPKSGEPDDYWLDLPLANSLAGSMEKSWAIVPAVVDSIAIKDGILYLPGIALPEIQSSGVFTNSKKILFLITQDVRDAWLDVFGDWVVCEKVDVKLDV